MYEELERGIREAESIFNHRVVKLAKLQYPNHPLPITFPSVKQFLSDVTHDPYGRHRKVQVYASARYRDMRVRYNPLWLGDEEYDYRFTVDLILHELGHLFTHRFLDHRGHGHPWKRVGQIVGYCTIGATHPLKRRGHPYFAIHVGRVEVAPTMLGKFAEAPGNRKRSTPGVTPSRANSPVRRCRRFFEENADNLTRAEMIAELVASGINRNTASTQYWRWNNGL